MVEFTDLIFAVDSIPAIFAITGDPFLVFTSNVFAILGLRSLYFALAGMIDEFRYLKVSLARRADGRGREDDDPRLAQGHWWASTSISTSSPSSCSSWPPASWPRCWPRDVSGAEASCLRQPRLRPRHGGPRGVGRAVGPGEGRRRHQPTSGGRTRTAESSRTSLAVSGT